MDRTSKKTIEAVVSIDSFEGSLPWMISEDKFFFVRLYPEISDENIGSVMLSACWLYSEEIAKDDPIETLKAFVSDESFVLGGGLLFKENDEIKVEPGCCGGLEDWNDWFDVPKGRVDIWTGHDPSNLIEIDEDIIKIWYNSEAKDENYSIEFTAEELVQHLENVEKDLKGFLLRLEQWTKNIAPGLERQVVHYFAENMNIKA